MKPRDWLIIALGIVALAMLIYLISAGYVNNSVIDKIDYGGS